MPYSSAVRILSDDLANAIRGTHLTARREGNSLFVRHPAYLTRIDVFEPRNRDSDNGSIKAVVRVRTELSSEMAAFLATPETAATMNAMATTAALTIDEDKIYLGSRLTLFASEDAWNVQAPLVLFSIVGGADSLLGAIRKTLTGQSSDESESAWTERDLAQVEQYLSRVCVCTTGGLGLSAEFALQDNAVSAIAGDRNTALWRILGDQPHPEVGGGLFCQLQLPHQFQQESRLAAILAHLNQVEMSTYDLPPHFGAWCRSESGNSPTYVSFLPNALHETPGIAVNMSVWAMFRAQWASRELSALGYTRAEMP